MSLPRQGAPRYEDQDEPQSRLQPSARPALNSRGRAFANRARQAFLLGLTCIYAGGVADTDIPELLANLRLWTQGGQQAPHKPLLLLFMLARVQRGEPRLIAWRELEGPLRELIERFGPPRKSVHPEFPFWRLRNDADGALWEVPEADELEVNSKGDVRVTDLRALDVHGGFTVEVDAALRDQPGLIEQLVTQLLDAYFEMTEHDEIRETIGMRKATQANSECSNG